MGQDIEELKRDIEYTRADMGGTLEAIGDRVSPARIVERKKNRIVSSAQSVRDRVMGTAGEARDHIAETSQSLSDSASEAKDALVHAPQAVAQKTQGAPLVAGAIAFGVGFLIAAAFPPSKKEMAASANLMDSLEPVKSQLVDSAREMADNLKQPAIDAAESVKAAASSGVDEVVSTTKDAAEQTKQHVADATHGMDPASPRHADM